ncbi:MAG: type 4a pilus biogenesis protein PilO [Actinomycetota bacterium]|nr:type 4a pilus biogenesis protein PilO [Actinomycetota bacterium]
MRNRTRLLVAIAIAVVVNILFLLFFVQPRRSDLSAARAQADTAEQQTQQLRATLAQLRSLQQQAPKLQSQLADFQQLVPDNNEVPHFIFQVQHAADQAGVSFLAIEPEIPKAPPEGAQLAEVRISIGADGGYFALQDFIRRLYALQRATRIDTLTLSTEGGTSGSSNPSPAPSGSPGTTSPSTSASEIDIKLSMDVRIFFALPSGATGGATAPIQPAPVQPSTAPAGAASPSPGA